jgi:hypothetical protein
MNTTVAIDGAKFLVNGRPTYEGRTYKGKSVEGLLLNSRMIQALFDDECAATRDRWVYPDSGAWDPDRNTDEFCAHLPEYRSYGLLAVTVGLQGGGSIYTKDVYDHYDNSAFTVEGEFKQPYFDRLARILKAADAAGMVVIVNYFYWKHVARITSDKIVRDITARTTAWLLESGYRNIIVDVANESNPFWKRPQLEPDHIHELIEIAQGQTLNGRRLLVGASTGGGDQLPTGKWRAIEDIALPHGNGCVPARLAAKLRLLKATPEHTERPRPIVVNEDSVFVENLEAAVAEGCSWGFYCQGYGSVYTDRMDWTVRPREDTYEELSGYQTVPVNWGINTEIKREFFEGVATITGG